MLGVLGVTPLAYNFATDIATWIFLKFFFSCSNLFVHSWNSHIFLSLLTDAYATIERRITEQTKRGRHKWCIHKVHIFYEGDKYLKKPPTLQQSPEDLKRESGVALVSSKIVGTKKLFMGQYCTLRYIFFICHRPWFEFLGFFGVDGSKSTKAF